MDTSKTASLLLKDGEKKLFISEGGGAVYEAVVCNCFLVFSADGEWVLSPCQEKGHKLEIRRGIIPELGL